jgi:hypothetical protein
MLDWVKVSLGTAMIFAILMLLVLAIAAAAWRRHALELPLFIVTMVWAFVYLIHDMTSPLSLSF